MKDFVCANPHLCRVDLNQRGDCPFLIVACDGVWDVLSDQEAVDFVLEKYRLNNGPKDGVAKQLVDSAHGTLLSNSFLFPTLCRYN